MDQDLDLNVLWYSPHLCGQPLGPMGPSGQRSHLSPEAPSLQLQRPLLSHAVPTEPAEKPTGSCVTFSQQDAVTMTDGRNLTCGVTEAGRAAQPSPLQVEPVLAALAVASFCVSLTVDTSEAPGVRQAEPSPPVTFAAPADCRRSKKQLCV